MRWAVACWLAFCLTGWCLAESKQITTKERLVEIVTPAPLGGDVTVDWEAREPLDLRYFTYRTAEGKSVVVFYMPADRVVMLSDMIDWEAKDRDARRQKITWIVTYDGLTPVPPGPGPTPPPTPPTPPPPAPDEFGLVSVAKEARSKIPAGELGLDLLPRVRANFLTTASVCAAGGISTLDGARDHIRQANMETFGGQQTEKTRAWHAWLMAVAAKLDELRTAGRLTDAKSFGRAMAEIAKGLE